MQKNHLIQKFDQNITLFKNIEDSLLKASEIIKQNNCINSQKAFLQDMKYWKAWMEANHIDFHDEFKLEYAILFIMQHTESMPDNVNNYLLNIGAKKVEKQHKFSTIERRFKSIARFLDINNKPNVIKDPKFKTLKSKLKKLFTKKVDRNKAITKNILLDLINTCNDNIIDIRDAAILSFAWASGGRRASEICDATWDNLEETLDGEFIYYLSQSKTLSVGQKHPLPIKNMAAKLLRRWIIETKKNKIQNKFIFTSLSKNGIPKNKLTPIDINRIVKKRAEFAGYNPKDFGAHSLRSGFVTEAGKQGKPIGDVMAMTTHKSVKILMEYYQCGNVLNNTAANLF